MSETKPKRQYPQRPPYIVWSPDGPTAPVVAHETHGSALFAAKQMAKKHAGQVFYVMQCASYPISKPAIEAPADEQVPA